MTDSVSGNTWPDRTANKPVAAGGLPALSLKVGDWLHDLTAIREEEDKHRHKASLMAARQVEDIAVMLEDDAEGMLRWPFQCLDTAMGPFLPGTLTVLGARPANGKTSLLLNCLQHWVRSGKRILYLGMETSPARLRLEWAALDCGYEKKLVLRKEWAQLPADARDRLRRHAAWQVEVGDRAIFADDEVVTLGSLRRWVEAGLAIGLDGVVIDHLHRMEYGAGQNPTEEMSRGIRDIKRLAVGSGMPVIAAAQLNRGERDILGDYEPAPLEALRQTGTTEQEADDVFMLHRVLRDTTTKGDRQLVRAGGMRLADVADQGVVGLHYAKARIDGEAKGDGLRLWIHGGRILESRAQWEAAKFGVTESDF